MGHNVNNAEHLPPPPPPAHDSVQLEVDENLPAATFGSERGMRVRFYGCWGGGGGVVPKPYMIPNP